MEGLVPDVPGIQAAMAFQRRSGIQAELLERVRHDEGGEEAVERLFHAAIGVFRQIGQGLHHAEGDAGGDLDDQFAFLPAPLLRQGNGKCLSCSPESTAALSAWSCFMPCTSTGKFICMASPVESADASMATAAVPSLTAAAHQLTTACPWAGTSTSRTAELSVSAESPCTAGASAGRSSRHPSFREMETRARISFPVRLRTRALSITMSFPQRSAGPAY